MPHLPNVKIETTLSRLRPVTYSKPLSNTREIPGLPHSQSAHGELHAECGKCTHGFDSEFRYRQLTTVVEADLAIGDTAMSQSTRCAFQAGLNKQASSLHTLFEFRQLIRNLVSFIELIPVMGYTLAFI